MGTPNDTRTLTGVLREMADEDAGQGSSALVEDRLRGEVRALRAARRRSRLTFAALAATLILALLTPLALLRQATAGGASRQASPAPALDAPFLATPYAGSFTGEGHLVRVEVPANTLTAFGAAAPAARDRRDNAPVLADVLIGEDGVARAIRFVGPAGGPADEVQR